MRGVGFLTSLETALFGATHCSIVPISSTRYMYIGTIVVEVGTAIFITCPHVPAPRGFSDPDRQSTYNARVRLSALQLWDEMMTMTMGKKIFSFPFSL
jgi:hypothetical protein